MSAQNLDKFLSDLKDDLSKQEDPAKTINFIKNYLKNTNSKTQNLSKKKIAPKRFSTNSPSDRVISLDIGGSLCKVCFYSSQENSFFKDFKTYLENCKHPDKLDIKDEEKDLSFNWNGGKFHFLKFPTHHFPEMAHLMIKKGILTKNQTLFSTGGGSYKYSSELKSRYGITTTKKDELTCLFRGLNFTLEQRKMECFYIENPNDTTNRRTNLYDMKNVYPYILVNIGSGVSIIRVISRDSFERVSGSFVGGGTFYGLCRLLTKITDFETLTKEAAKGDSNKVNMTVRDIYSGDYKNFRLDGDIVASAFGKLASKKDPWEDLEPGDISVSIGYMICVNIAQMANFCAEKYGIKHILFAGNFLRKNRLSENAVTGAVSYWSNGKAKALMLEHEGYFGAIGAMIDVK